MSTRALIFHMKFVHIITQRCKCKSFNILFVPCTFNYWDSSLFKSWPWGNKWGHAQGSK